jgi:hypothetical protein
MSRHNSSSCPIRAHRRLARGAALNPNKCRRQKEEKSMEHLRWLIEIDYRTKNGTTTVDHHVEELDELHDVVELGPDWNTIEEIRARLNPRRTSHPGDTVEASLRR